MKIEPDFQPSEAHRRTRGWTERVTTKQLRQVQLRGPYTRWGLLCDFKAKSLGAGVYEITLKERS